MSSLILRRIAHGSPEYAATVALRYRILREPLGLTFTEAMLSAEASDLHLAAYENDTLLACLVLTPRSPDTVQMRQVAVETARQGSGIGSRLVVFSEETARAAGFRTMTLHARETAVPFYLRLGYALVGEPFEEVTLPHREMQKSL